MLISSPAKYGVHGVVAAWPHPLGVTFGLAQKKALVRNDEVVAAMAFTFAMNWDRRVMAGAQAARFFGTHLRAPAAPEPAGRGSRFACALIWRAASVTITIAALIHLLLWD